MEGESIFAEEEPETGGRERRLGDVQLQHCMHRLAFGNWFFISELLEECMCTKIDKTVQGGDPGLGMEWTVEGVDCGRDQYTPLHFITLSFHTSPVLSLDLSRSQDTLQPIDIPLHCLPLCLAC